jgi:hypothetical protein
VLTSLAAGSTQKKKRFLPQLSDTGAKTSTPQTSKQYKNKHVSSYVKKRCL